MKNHGDYHALLCKRKKDEENSHPKWEHQPNNTATRSMST